MAQDIIELSQIAHEYHQEFGYQEYISWVKEDLKLSETYGKNLLRVNDKFGATVALDQIGIKALFLLSAPSTPEAVRQEAVELAESGETVTHAKAKELAEAHKEIERLKQLANDLSGVQTYPLMSNIQELLDKGQIMPAKAKALQTLTPEGQAVWFTDYIQKLSAENQLEEQKAKVKQLESQPKIEVEKIVEVIPDDYEKLKKQVDDLTKTIELKKEQLKKEVKEKTEITELKNNVEKSLVKKLDKANEELSKLDNKRREIKALQDLDEASKLISRAHAFFTDDQGMAITSITITILKTVEGIKNKLELFRNQDSEIIDII